MTDEEREVRTDSDELLGALNSMKAAEDRKRREEISTPSFHQLADEVEARAKVVWETAARERMDGERTQTTNVTISEVEPENPPAQDVVDGRATQNGI